MCVDGFEIHVGVRGGCYVGYRLVIEVDRWYKGKDEKK